MKKHHRTSHSQQIALVKTVGIASALLTGGFSLSATADFVPQAFNIPAQPMDSALTELADRADLRLLYQADTVGHLRSRPVSGARSPEQALSLMLADSGLNYRKTAGNAITIERTESAEKPGAMAEANNVATLKPMTVKASSLNGSDSAGEDTPDNTSYNRSNASSSTRTDTPLMETPISVQVVPRAVLQDQQSIQVGDAIKNVSGVFQGFSFGGFAEEFMIRGFNTQFNNYLDGFRWPASRLTLANAERVEVVKGAAANLYGRIQPGGMINIVTKRPQAKPYYALEQQFGSYDLYRTTADATGALNDDGSLMYRLNIESFNKNSFRDFAFTDRVFVAPSLTWKISDRTQLDVDFIYSNEDTQEDYGVVALGTRPADIPISRYLHEPSTDISNSTLYNTAITLSHEFNDDWKVKARFNHFRRETTDIQTAGYALDENPGNATYGDLTRFYYGSFNPSDNFYANVNLGGHFTTWDIDHRVLVGWENYNTDSDYVDQQFGDGATINIFHPRYQPVDASAIPHSFSDFGTGKAHSNGVYFQDQITLFDKLHVLGGGRYDWVTDAGGYSDISAEDAIANQSVLNIGRFSPRVGLLYQPWQWLSVYGNYVESMGSGNSALGRGGEVLAPEIGEQFEIGFKTAFFDERLTSSFAYYHLTKSNIAVSTNQGFADLIGSARSQGIELDISGQVTDGLSLIASYAYTDAIIIRSTDFNGDVLDGHRLWNVPRNAGSLWAKYDLQQEPLRGLSLGAGVYFQDQKEGQRNNDIEKGGFQLPGWGRVDALVKYQLPLAKAKTTVQFNIENLLDHRYYTATLGDRFTINVGQPRTFMGSVKVEF